MMKKRKKLNGGIKLLLVMLMALFAVAAHINVNAASMPSSGSLTIHKYTLENMDNLGIPNDGNPVANIPDGAVPLAGIEFSIWQVDPSAAATVTTPAEAKAKILANTKQSGITDSEGSLTFSSLPQGLYYVAETGNAENKQMIYGDPFLVSVPMRNPVTNDWIADVHVYPKNQALIIDKFVGPAGNEDYPFNDYAAAKHRPVAINEAFGWSIFSSIPADLGKANAVSYTVTDNLKEYFDYISGSVKVYSVPTTKTRVQEAHTLDENSDYTLTFDQVASTITVELTASGLALMSKRYKDDNDRFILIKYDSKLNNKAINGISLLSGADLEYRRNSNGSATVSNSESQIRVVSLLATENPNDTATLAAEDDDLYIAKETVTEEPSVSTGQIGIVKLEDGKNKVLPGAEFGLAESEAKALAKDFLATGVTDANGILTFTGLKYGNPGDTPTENTSNTTYWLVETKAPSGYKLMKDPAKVTFSYQKDGNTGEGYFAQLEVYNVPDGTAGTTGTSPKTGDTNHIYFYWGLAALSFAIFLFLFFHYKKKKASALEDK